MYMTTKFQMIFEWNYNIYIKHKEFDKQSCNSLSDYGNLNVLICLSIFKKPIVIMQAEVQIQTIILYPKYMCIELELRTHLNFTKSKLVEGF